MKPMSIKYIFYSYNIWYFYELEMFLKLEKSDLVLGFHDKPQVHV